MGLLDRALQVIRASLNGVVNQAEDPERVLNQVMDDMQNHLIQLRQAVAQAIATQKRTERQSVQARSLAQEWYNRAELALKNGEEDLARQALGRRQSYLESAEMMTTQVSQQQHVVTQMKENVRQLEYKIAEAKTQKDMYIARFRSAEATQRLQELMGGAGAIAAFDQMEQRVLDLESRSQALVELAKDPLEDQFARLEGSSSDVDRELAAMKYRLMSGSGETN
ncbi:MAG: PspA/IM30 family protein [Nodosilinea sp.]